ncbi:MAG: carboxypeptidase-like regulatory domain-containing protein [Bacteroidales bacterium]|nr:carboxypeptidase-like regulatory domain-containing protein [Bacteroidales bacterium]MBN2761751.1 carboxypeptidase-like regulatory domain-containing protein [Bacteroidales bacterium]
MKCVFALFVFFHALFFTGLAQEKNLIQLTGRISNELHEPLPFSHILIMNSYRGAITNNDGRFSLVVEEGDTVLFSSVGYKRKYLRMPQSMKEPFLQLDIVLAVDTIMINAVEIYPWKSYEEFKEAFVNLKLPTDDMERARRNIALLRTQIIMDHDPDARENYKHIMEQQYRQTYTQGQYPSYQILNPFAWAKFFEALKRGDFKSKKKKSN